MKADDLDGAIDAVGAVVFRHEVPLELEPFAHGRLATMLGHTAGELPHGAALIDWLVERIHPEDWARVEGAYRSFLEGAALCFDQGLRLRHEEGYWVDLDVYAGAVERYPAGRPRAVVGVARDVTQRRFEEQRRHQSEQMEGLRRFADMLTRDLSNVLTVILGSGRLALESIQEGGTPRGEIREMMRAAQNAEGLLAALATFTGGESALVVRPPTRVEPQSGAAGPRGDETVIVAENDEQVRELIAKGLAHLGYRVLPVSDAEGAVRALGESPGAGLLVLDTEVLETGRCYFTPDRVASTKVLYLSGHTPHALACKALVAPDAHVLHKPFSLESLARTVRELLDT